MTRTAQHMTCSICHQSIEHGHASMLTGEAQILCTACAADQKTQFQPMCDFCTGRPVCWSYPCQSYEVPWSPVENVKMSSTEDWAACHACHTLIQLDAWEELAQRSASVNIALNPNEHSPQERLQLMRSLHAEFRKNRLGTPTRYLGW